MDNNSIEIGKRIKQRREELGITQNELGGILGLNKSTIQRYEAGKISKIKLPVFEIIAKQLNVDQEWLAAKTDVMNKNSKSKCAECGFVFDKTAQEDISAHMKNHIKWKTAVREYGFCWEYSYRETVKSEARGKIKSNPKLPISEYIDLQKLIFKALFSRSVEGLDYALNHISFSDYCAALLNQKPFKDSIRPDVYIELVNQFGTNNLIPEGTYYKTDKGYHEDNKIENLYNQFDNISPIRTQRIPLLGEIACGKPIFCEEDRESYVEVGADIRADFCLRAKGDSMIGARIMDGDIVFIREQPMVENGEIAAVIIDDEATLKRVYYDQKNGKLVLQAENPKYSPLVYVGEELNSIRILGKAIAFESNL